MSVYNEESLKKIASEYKKLESRLVRILELYLNRKFNEPAAKEHAHQGFLRRVYILRRCIENIYEIVSPDSREQIQNDQRYDLEINLQSFIFNTFGCVDNLAWIWVLEKNVTRADGSALPRTFVGLRRKNTFVRESFSPAFQEHLSAMDEWFEYVENFRHAIAHGIPVYVPPFIIQNKDQDEYLEIEAQKNLALLNKSFDEYENLEIAQNRLGRFRPVMTHSFREKSRVSYFHAQILTDFMTVEDLAVRLASELEALGPTRGA